MNVAFQALAQNAASKLAVAELALFKAGQVLQALVVAQTSAGLAQLKIGDMLIEAQLPQAVPPGTTLQLQVKTGGNAPQLVLVSQQAPAVAVQVPQAARVPVPLPVASVVLPPEAGAPPALALSPVPIPTPAVQGAQGVGPQGPGPAIVAPIVQPQGAIPQGAIPQGPQAPALPVQTVTAEPVIAQQVQAVAQPASQIESGPAVPVAVQQANVTIGPPVQAAVQSPAQPQPSVTMAAPAPEATAAQVPAANAVVPQAPGALGAPVVTLRPEAAVQPQAVAPQAAAPEMGPMRAVPVDPQPVERQVATQASVGPGRGPSAPEPAAPSPLLLAQAAPKVQQTVADLPKLAPVPVQPAAPQALPATPEQAVAQMVPEAMGKQNSVAPLLQTLAVAVGQPGLLPEPVVRAALQVLGQRIVAPDGKVQAGDIEAAVARSGVFLEARLAAQAPVTGDAKAALVNLKAVLEKVLGGAAPAGPPEAREPPPLRGQPPRAMPTDAPPLPDGPRDLVRTLHNQTDAAISRVKLGQLAGLPDAPGTPRAAPAELRMELPFLIGHELVMAQVQIAPDGRRQETNRKRGWTMRFAMNFSQTGEVGAEVGLLGKSVNVALWAAEPETAAALNAALPDLAAALEALGLDPGPVRIRNGVPEPAKIASGHFVDALT